MIGARVDVKARALLRAAVVTLALAVLIPALLMGATFILVGIAALHVGNTTTKALDGWIEVKRDRLSLRDGAWPSSAPPMPPCKPPRAAVVSLRQRGLREWARYDPIDTPDDAA